MTELKEFESKLIEYQNQSILLNTLEKYQFHLDPQIINLLNKIKFIISSIIKENKQLMELLSLKSISVNQMQNININLIEIENDLKNLKENYVGINEFIEMGNNLIESANKIICLKTFHYENNSEEILYISEQSIYNLLNSIKPFLIPKTESANKNRNIFDLLIDCVFLIGKHVPRNILLYEKPIIVDFLVNIIKNLKNWLECNKNILNNNFFLPRLDSCSRFFRFELKREMEFNKEIKLYDFLGKKEWVTSLIYFSDLIETQCISFEAIKDFL